MTAEEIAHLLALYTSHPQDELIKQLFIGTKGIFWKAYCRYGRTLNLSEDEATSFALECLVKSMNVFQNDDGDETGIGKRFCAFYQTSLLNAFCNLVRYQNAKKRYAEQVSYEDWMAQSTDGGVESAINRLTFAHLRDDLTYDEYLLLVACKAGYSLREWSQWTGMSLYQASYLLENIRIFYHEHHVLPDHYQPRRKRRLKGKTIAEEKESFYQTKRQSQSFFYPFFEE